MSSTIKNDMVTYTSTSLVDNIIRWTDIFKKPTTRSELYPNKGYDAL